ncbi:MAG: MBL fold metallo-hydrolase [Planctomycetota bacterium]
MNSRLAFGIAFAFALAACASNAQPNELQGSRYELFVLGTAQDGGLPHFGCDRACCAEARRTGRVLHPTSLGVVDHETGKLLLIEATPKIEEQVALLHRLAGTEARGRTPVDAVLLTHAHMGHYLGLAWFGREVASATAVATYCTERMAAFLRGHGPWKQLVELGQLELHAFPPGDVLTPLPGLTVLTFSVPHRDEFSDTVAYVLIGPRRRVLFVPDVDAWERAPELLAQLMIDVDVAFIDGTFYDGRELPDRNLAEIRHPLMTDTMERLQGMAASKNGLVRFLHCNHTNPVLHDEALRRALEQRGFRLAETGERVGL